MLSLKFMSTGQHTLFCILQNSFSEERLGTMDSSCWLYTRWHT